MNPEEKKEKENTSDPAGSSGVAEIPADELEALKKKAAELEELRDKMLRTAAEFENAKKRLAREKEEYLKFGQEELIRSLLPVIDNFERSASYAGAVADPAVKAIVSGVQMVQKQLLEVLKAQGLARLETVGQPFDPHRHESVGFVQEDGPEDTVAEEIQPGYTLHDRLLRAAKVRVRIAPGDSAPKPGDEKDEEIT